MGVAAGSGYIHTTVVTADNVPKLEYQKSHVRSKVEYVLHITGIFGFRKTRYRGLQKLKTQLDVLCASANFFMLASARKAERIRNSQTALLFDTQFQG